MEGKTAFNMPYSFHWNLAYADLLWDKNIVRSLKNTAEIVLQNRTNTSKYAPYVSTEVYNLLRSACANNKELAIFIGINWVWLNL
jgi:hypothetical protein